MSGRRKPSYAATHAHGHPSADVQGRVLVHRLVMEKQLGRYLTEEEVVHHENLDPKDNRIENLRLFANQAEHLAYHREHYQTPLQRREHARRMREMGGTAARKKAGETLRARLAKLTPEQRRQRVEKAWRTRWGWPTEGAPEQVSKGADGSHAEVITR